MLLILLSSLCCLIHRAEFGIKAQTGERRFDGDWLQFGVKVACQGDKPTYGAGPRLQTIFSHKTKAQCEEMRSYCQAKIMRTK